MGVKKVLTEKFLEALERLEFTAEFVLLMGTVRPTILSYSKLEERLARDWDGGLIKLAIRRLLQSGCLKRKTKDKYFLTAKGLGKILELRIEKKMKNEKKMRNKYLVLIFDIPEENRAVRNLFRGRLKILGFEMIQQSVWIIQHNVLTELKELIEIYGIEEYVKFFIAEKV